MAPPAGLVEGVRLSAFTFLPGHFDGGSVAERPLPFARRVHLVLDAAVDDPELDLRARRRGAENRTTVPLIRNTLGYCGNESFGFA